MHYVRMHTVMPSWQYCKLMTCAYIYDASYAYVSRNNRARQSAASRLLADVVVAIALRPFALLGLGRLDRLHPLDARVLGARGVHRLHEVDCDEGGREVAAQGDRDGWDPLGWS